MLKADLRTIYLPKQQALSPTERLYKSQMIGESFFRNFELKNFRYAHIFLPIEKNGEIETHFIYEKIWKNPPKITTLLPRVNFEKNTIESLEFNKKTPLIKNRWQIKEPTAGKLIEAKKIDLVLVPLLCFDDNGFRVGYGKGFYDRFLKTCRADCLKIGLSYFPPEKEILDVNENDVRLNYCLTPR